METAIRIQQKSQEERTRWEQEKTRLVNEYEMLLQQKQFLEKENKTLAAQQDNQKVLIQNLRQQKEESIRIQEELSPFLTGIYTQFEALVANDPPFLKEERNMRLVNLSKVMKDPEITIAEKFRKIMEALFIEAEYGSTIEVYQDTIQLESTGQDETLCNIFRLGRVSLFFLSLDQAICGVFNPGENKWQSLPDKHLPAIRSAFEIGSKRKPVELLPLPLGRLVTQGGAL